MRRCFFRCRLEPVSSCHQRRRRQRTRLLQFDNRPVHAGCQPEIVSIENEGGHATHDNTEVLWQFLVAFSYTSAGQFS